MSPLEFMQRLAALAPLPRLNLIRFASFCFAKYLLTPFHGVLAPDAKLSPKIIPGEKKSKIAHPMRMTMYNIPRFPCVSVGHACYSGCLISTSNTVRTVVEI
ncbi:hypothetical protein NTGM5_330028 [Candidatus Nitrotoga sp. M5]|nr:hypothetical protein NTGM5_330028 [Candidatus Nitrotoga sp. M5]